MNEYDALSIQNHHTAKLLNFSIWCILVALVYSLTSSVFTLSRIRYISPGNFATKRFNNFTSQMNNKIDCFVINYVACLPFYIKCIVSKIDSDKFYVLFNLCRLPYNLNYTIPDAYTVWQRSYFDKINMIFLANISAANIKYFK